MPQYQQPAGVIHSVLKIDGGEAHRDACAGKHRPQQGADARRELIDARSKNIPAAAGPFRPAFWDSKLYGEPFGNFHRRRLPASAKGNVPSNKEQLPYQKRIPSAQLGDLARLEQTMRAVVNRRATVHEPDKVQLLNAFAKALGKRRAEPKDMLRLEQFQQAWKQFDVALSHLQAEAIFNKYGQNVSGRMPVMVFVNAFLAGAPRAAVRCNAGILRGPLSPQKRNMQELAGNVKIMYPHCKHGVFAPTDWDPVELERSAAVPDKTMELDFVHGYEGRSTLSSNLHYNAEGRIIYHVAAVGIVYCAQTHEQSFFHGHNDDILCMALHPNKMTVASGQVAALETRDCQNGMRRADPCVLVWSSETLKEESRLFHGRGMRGVSCVEFSCSGKTLVSVCTDDSHTMFVWSWQRAQCLLSRKTRAGAAPDVSGVSWSPYTADEMCTFGIHHVFFWKLIRKPGKESVKTGEKLGAELEAGQWGKLSPHTVFCCCWMPSGALLTGCDDGSIITWKNWKCVDKVSAHARGPTVQRADGSNSFNGVRAIKLIREGRELVTCGGDGFVKIFQVTAAGDLGVSSRSIPLRQGDAEAGAPAPLARSLAVDDTGNMIVGTASCDIWHVSPDGHTKTILFGHRADVIGLAMNPKPEYSHIFATCSDSCKVAVWSMVTRKIVSVVSVPERARCLAFAPNGEHLAVGMHSGALAVLSFHPTVQQLSFSVPCSDSITVLAYSPDGKYIAAGSRDQSVTILDMHKSLSMRLVGHSSTIRSIDWSTDSKFVLSTDQACELVIFDVQKCQVSKDSHRDQPWNSWTSVLGFPVMGIWQAYADGTDINAVHRSPNGQYLLTADDSGLVNLFASPCIAKNAGHFKFGGHSSHVSCVRWSACGQYAVSIGGKDHAVFVWKIADLKVPELIRPEAQPPWALHI